MKKLAENYNELQRLIDQGKIRDAIDSMEKLLSENPGFGQGYHDLGGLYLTVGDTDKAEASFLKAIDCEPDTKSFLKSLGDFYYTENKDSEKALALYERAIEKDQLDPELLFIAGNLCLVANRLDDSVVYYEKVLDIEPWHMEAFDYLEKVKARIKGGSDTRQGERKDDFYEKAYAFGNEGRYEKAVAVLKKTLDTEPENALVHNDLGVFYYQLGEEEKCLKHYTMAVQLDPVNSNYRKNLADFLCFVKGELVKALTIYLKLLHEDPEDIEVLMAAGHLSRQMERYEEAKLFYERVLDIEPWNYDAGEQLDFLKQRVGLQAAVN